MAAAGGGGGSDRRPVGGGPLGDVLMIYYCRMIFSENRSPLFGIML
jgi:hypothetical protein